MNYLNLKEEPLKSAVRDDFFGNYKYTQLGNIDFVIAKHNTDKGALSLFEGDSNDSLKSVLWAEAKQGKSHPLYESFIQLILTIGKEKTYEKYLPPKYIGAFDAEKFAFIEYSEIQGVFYQNDFNWNVTPSDHSSKEFSQLYDMCEKHLQKDSVIFYYNSQSHELKKFISLNFKTVKEGSEKISVTKNNFTFVFHEWDEKVKPTIDVDWERVGKSGIIPADFFLADLLSSDSESLKDNLYVVLKKTKYEISRGVDEDGLPTFTKIGFSDRQKAYKEFWSIYERPPREEYWSYIIGRRDLLVPQDIRERHGSFFTPPQWVRKSQEYLADVLGEDWQDEYYVWDCCAGTGNLLNGLVNKRNLWASTLDKADVDVMKDRAGNGWNMFDNHIFQFDFLNDDFSKCPEELQEILKDKDKRKRLVVYINPPYAEAGGGMGKTKANVATANKVYERYKNSLGNASNEIFAQFLMRIKEEIGGCMIGNFSTLKIITGSNFSFFRKSFGSLLEKLFIVPADTFDNVTGKFPIGFFIWNTDKDFFSASKAGCVDSDVYSYKEEKLQDKKFYIYNKDDKLINNWLRQYADKESKPLGIMHNNKNDFQHNSQVCITSDDNHDHTTPVTAKNLIPMCVYHAVRHCIEHTWINHNDQFYSPDNKWKSDAEFQADCLIYTLFHDKNRVVSGQGVNYWIPFTEEQCGCRSSFKSDFMSKYLADMAKANPLSESAKAVYDAGLELWRYYHSYKDSVPDASFYDIRKYFQGEKNGRMNAKSEDEKYTEIISRLRLCEKALGGRIAVKTYEHGFLK